MADSAAHQTYPPPSNHHRRNSIPSSSSAAATPPLNGTVSPPPPPPPPIDLKLLSSKSPSQSYYTSLRDVLPSAAANSPTAASAASSGYEISIRNRLVKQAAWAYLQPMSASSYSAAPNFFQRFCLRLSAANPISRCFGFITGTFIPSVIRFLRFFCICF